MGRTVQWFGVLLLIGGCRCDAPAPEVASAPETVSNIERDSPEEAALKENCGVDPEIRKARRAKQIAREAEEARLRALQVHAAEIDAENTRQIEALRKRNETCGSEVMRVDPECAAFVEGRSDECPVAEGAISEDCQGMALLGGAIRTGEVLSCDRLTDRAFRALCRGAVSGAFTCRSRGRGALWKACRALRDSRPEAVCLSTRRDQNACNVVELITAIRSEAVSGCATVSRESTRSLCEAWYTGVEKCSRPVGGDSPECRDILLLPLSDSLGSEGEWTLRYINLFSESATCVVVIRGVEGTETRVELGVLASGSGLQEKGIQRPADVAVPLDVSAECVWDMP